MQFEVLQKYGVIGGGWRPECACPECRSSDRERLVYEFLRRKTDVFRHSTSVLHLAPEANLRKVLARDSLADPYLTSDLQMPEASVHADLTALPFPDASFGLIICNHVLEHIKDEAQALSELRRILRKGGMAVLQVPISRMNAGTDDESPQQSLAPAERELRFGQNDHVRLYGQDYPKRLERAGFRVGRWNFAAQYGAALAEHLGIKALEDVFYVQYQ